jgi:tRNA G10  N-methylase Trm11
MGIIDSKTCLCSSRNKNINKDINKDYIISLNSKVEHQDYQILCQKIKIKRLYLSLLEQKRDLEKQKQYQKLQHEQLQTIYNQIHFNDGLYGVEIK